MLTRCIEKRWRVCVCVCVCGDEFTSLLFTSSLKAQHLRKFENGQKCFIHVPKKTSMCKKNSMLKAYARITTILLKFTSPVCVVCVCHVCVKYKKSDSWTRVTKKINEDDNDNNNKCTEYIFLLYLMALHSKYRMNWYIISVSYKKKEKE